MCSVQPNSIAMAGLEPPENIASHLQGTRLDSYIEIS